MYPSIASKLVVIPRYFAEIDLTSDEKFFCEIEPPPVIFFKETPMTSLFFIISIIVTFKDFKDFSLEILFTLALFEMM